MLRVPRLGGPNTPKFLLTDEVPEPDTHVRTELARMLTSHPQFARAAVNLFWSKMMGIGIVEPVDEFDLARQDPDNLPEAGTKPSPRILSYSKSWRRISAKMTTACTSSLS